MKYTTLLLIIVLAACRPSANDRLAAATSLNDDDDCYYEWICRKTYPAPALKGFEPGEMDTLILYKYAYGSGFSGRAIKEIHTYKGSVVSDMPFFPDISITDSFDYVLEIPGANKVYRIVSPAFQPEVRDSVPCFIPNVGCYNWVTQLSVNNDSVQVTGSSMHSCYIVLYP